MVKNPPVNAGGMGDTGLIPEWGRSPGEEIGHPLWWSRVSQVAQMVKNLPAMQDTWVRSLGLEDPLEGGHGNPLQYSWLENPESRAWQATVRGIAKSQTRLSN